MRRATLTKANETVSRWPVLPLGEICEINPKLPRDRLSPGTEITFVPMSAIDEAEGVIARPEVRTYDEVSKGYTVFTDNDVLFAKITPCMQNGKAAVARELRNGIGVGSTEFHVLRAGSRVSPKWLFFLVRQKAFRDQAAASFTGTAGQQRVPTSFLSRYQVLVPPISEQDRIVSILDQADGLRAKRRVADTRMADIIPAIFHEMFGDPANNQKGWQTGRLGDPDVGTLDRGRSRHRPRDEESLYGGPYPFIQTGEIAQSDGEIHTYSKTYSELGLAQSRLWPAGTLCITIAANIAKTAVLTFDACFPDSIVGFIPGPTVTTEYVQTFLGFLQEHLEAMAPQAAQKNINLKVLSELSIPLPPRELQDTFSRHVAAARSLRRGQTESRGKLDALFDSLLHRAFRGDL